MLTYLYELEILELLKALSHIEKCCHIKLDKWF